MAKFLERVYASYNKKYFRNQLPKVRVHWSEQIGVSKREKSRQAYGWFSPGEGDDVGTVRIASDIKHLNSVWRGTLLHEMCHVAVQDDPEEAASSPEKHTKVWQKEMKRLAAANAFADIW